MIPRAREAASRRPRPPSPPRAGWVAFSRRRLHFALRLAGVLAPLGDQPRARGSPVAASSSRPRPRPTPRRSCSSRAGPCTRIFFPPFATARESVASPRPPSLRHRRRRQELSRLDAFVTVTKNDDHGGACSSPMCSPRSADFPTPAETPSNVDHDDRLPGIRKQNKSWAKRRDLVAIHQGAPRDAHSSRGGGGRLDDIVFGDGHEKAPSRDASLDAIAVRWVPLSHLTLKAASRTC